MILVSLKSGRPLKIVLKNIPHCRGCGFQNEYHSIGDINTVSPRLSTMQVFTTVHPGQREVCLMLYRGESQVASRNKQLGQFHLVGLPEAPIGVPQIEVSPPALM